MCSACQWRTSDESENGSGQTKRDGCSRCLVRAYITANECLTRPLLFRIVSVVSSQLEVVVKALCCTNQIQSDRSCQTCIVSGVGNVFPATERAKRDRLHGTYDRGLACRLRPIILLLLPPNVRLDPARLKHYTINTAHASDRCSDCYRSTRRGEGE